MSYKRREHWSIGEVLNLLQDEFPEVTISKIRFLEGQGLIDPERTPSGYRRFYPEDFDRLRWVLIQQRDHYLPLKIIRERLDSGEVVFEEGGPFPDTGPEQRTLGFEDGDDGPSEPAPTQAEVEVVSDEAVAEVEAPTSATTENTNAAPPKPVAAAPAVVEADSQGATPNSAETAQAAAPKAAAPPVKATQPIPEPVAPVKRPKKTASQKAAAKKVDRSMNAAVVALSRDELLEAAGCSSALLNDLERHGLVHGRKAGSSIVYDSAAVEVAKIGTRFADHGLDPRHLRSFRLNAEREVGLFSQIVGPQFHRRAPAARQESLEALDDLTGLADSLRSILMTQLLKDEFPGA